MEISLHLWLLVAVVVFLAYFVFGMTGFGTSIVAVPLLAHALPLPFIVSLLVVLDSVGTLWMGQMVRRDLHVAELKLLVPFSVMGMVVGVTLLVKLPGNALLASLGFFSLGMGLYSLYVGPRSSGAASRAWSFPAGFAGGIFTALFGIGGPIYAAYLSRRIPDVSAFRATMSIMIAIHWAVRVCLYLLAGLLLQAKLLMAALALAPVMAIGLVLGVRAHARVNPLLVRRMIAAIIAVAGLSILRTVFFPLAV